MLPVFEKYSEDALRSLFYARHAVSEHGGAEILPEHVVLGVLIGAPATIQRFAANLESAESLRARLVAHIGRVEKLATEVEIPFAEPTREALLQSAIEADEWQGGHIEPEHLLLGVLVKTSGVAADALLDAGVAIVGIRQFLQIPPQG